MAHSHHMHREHQVSHRRVDKILEEHGHEAKTHAKGHAFSKVTSKTAAENHDRFCSGGSAPKRYARGGKVKKADGGKLAGDVIPIRNPLSGVNNAGAQGQKANERSQNPNLSDPKNGNIKRIYGKRGGAFARGGKVKHGKSGHQTNIAIITPHHPAGGQSTPPIPAGPTGGLPPGGPPPLPMGAGPPGGPPGMPPGMPPRGGPPGMPRARGGRAGVHIDGESTSEDIKKWDKRAKGNSYATGGRMTAGSMTGVGRLELAAIAKRKK